MDSGDTNKRPEIEANIGSISQSSQHVYFSTARFSSFCKTMLHWNIVITILYLQAVALNVVTPPMFTNTSETEMRVVASVPATLFCHAKGQYHHDSWYIKIVNIHDDQVNPNLWWPGEELMVRVSTSSTGEARPWCRDLCSSWETWDPGMLECTCV